MSERKRFFAYPYTQGIIAQWSPLAHVPTQNWQLNDDNELEFCVRLTPREMTLITSALLNGAEIFDESEYAAAVGAWIRETNAVGCGNMTLYRIENCTFQKSTDGGQTWTDEYDISECVGANGRTPELRSVASGDCVTIQWKYTDEAASSWRTLGTICDGDDGNDGANGRTPELRSVASGDCVTIQWKYTDEAASSWRTLGTICDGDDASSRELEFRQETVEDCVLIDWRYVGDNDWRELATICQPQPEFRSTRNGQCVTIEYRVGNNWTEIATICDGSQGPQGQSGLFEPSPFTMTSVSRCLLAKLAYSITLSLDILRSNLFSQRIPLCEFLVLLASAEFREIDDEELVPQIFDSPGLARLESAVQFWNQPMNQIPISMPDEVYCELVSRMPDNIVWDRFVLFDWLISLQDSDNPIVNLVGWAIPVYPAEIWLQMAFAYSFCFDCEQPECD